MLVSRMEQCVLTGQQTKPSVHGTTRRLYCSPPSKIYLCDGFLCVVVTIPREDGAELHTSHAELLCLYANGAASHHSKIWYTGYGEGQFLRKRDHTLSQREFVSPLQWPLTTPEPGEVN